VFRGNETSATEFIRTISSTSEAMAQLVVNSMVFNFSRISAYNSMPVMSKLVISPVSNSLNGSVMNCVGRDTEEVSSTTIVIRERGTLQGMNLSCSTCIQVPRLFSVEKNLRT
jgi:hypothetical protein